MKAEKVFINPFALDKQPDQVIMWDDWQPKKEYMIALINPKQCDFQRIGNGAYIIFTAKSLMNYEKPKLNQKETFMIHFPYRTFMKAFERIPKSRRVFDVSDCVVKLTFIKQNRKYIEIKDTSVYMDFFELVDGGK